MAKKKAAKKAPAKTSKPKHTLTVEYMGIVSLVWHKTLGPKAKKKEAEVWLVDVGATGRARHFPCLTVPTNVIAPGDAPDIVVAAPGVYDAEFGGWDLSQSVVEIISDRTVPFSAKYRALSAKDRTNSKFPDDANLDWLADLGEVTGNNCLKAVPPVIARVTNVKGLVKPLFVGNEADTLYTFKDGSTEIGTPKRFLAWHFIQEIGYDSSVTIEIANAARGLREVKIVAPKTGQLDRRITISNLCRCADDGNADHFYSFYELLESGQKPVIIDQPNGGAVPGDEEHCGGNFIIDPGI